MPEKIGTKRKDNPAKIPTTLGPQRSPNIIGTVLIPAFLSPSISFMSRTFDKRVNITTIAKANVEGKTDTYLRGEIRKKPAKTAVKQQSPIIKEEKKGMILNLVGGAL